MAAFSQSFSSVQALNQKTHISIPCNSAYVGNLRVTQHFLIADNSSGCMVSNHVDPCKRGQSLIMATWSVEGASQDVELPSSIELEPITSEKQFDRVIAEAQDLEESVIILWMASWCRKCVYLKPKLEKLATEYYPRIQFYCINVNSVPQRLVNRAAVTCATTSNFPTLSYMSRSLMMERTSKGLCSPYAHIAS
ncbi:thioredoxin-like 3-1, chloroplastic isoform X2 [Amborella trichopoda]|uniref:thioredoxin-like 3-1, chloroplastic isoform X2 n=1 Tax=Amborella trichopoda TaxID=13333 RepID=UPI0009C00129|nr:thioredoxin-like 3-1, chloroplastic isoform X2 [Amborella trichopoda]|eukprot:XP_020525556.1 thioredoxin-like 3-1, chloroplastic isoform X2 [Amborella trichopoda]